MSEDPLIICDRCGLSVSTGHSIMTIAFEDHPDRHYCGLCIYAIVKDHATRQVVAES